MLRLVDGFGDCYATGNTERRDGQSKMPQHQTKEDLQESVFARMSIGHFFGVKCHTFG